MSSSTFASEVRRGLLAVACFLAALFALDRGLSVAMAALESRYAPESDFTRQLASYLESHSFNTLVLGTSRTNEGIMPGPLEASGRLRVFKEAFQGKGPRYQLPFYRLFKKLAGRPALVIYGVDYFIYSGESDRRLLSRFSSEPPDEPPGPLAAPLLLPRQKHRHDVFFNDLIGDLHDTLTRRFAPAADLFEQSRLYTGVPIGPENPRLLTQKPASWSRAGMPPPPGVEGAYFDQLLGEMNADGVTVVLVSLPDYIGTYDTNVDLPVLHDRLRELGRRHPNVTALIYNDSSRFDLADPSLFVDGGWGRTNSHLSARGATAFSKLLARDVDALLAGR